MDPRQSLIQLFCLFNMTMALLLPAPVQPCKHCAGIAQMEAKAIHSLRIEMVKQRILEKLRMDKVPVMQKQKRPVPIKVLRDMMMQSDRHVPQSNDVQDYGLDEFFAKESQMVIFAQLGGGRCVTKGSSHVACLSFSVPPVLFKKSIPYAELHLNVKRGHPMKALTLRDKNDEKEMTPMVQLEEIKEGWLPIPITLTVERWSRRESTVPFSIQVSCESCSQSELQKLINLDGDFAPFIVLNTETKSHNRNRRGVDCHQGMSNCCKESLFINFTDIGWDNWIIEPKGYAANYCKGSCTAALQSQNFHHGQIIQSFQETIGKGNSNTKVHVIDAGISTCCAPTRMATLNLLFYDGDGTVHRSMLPNMSVEACGCS